MKTFRSRQDLMKIPSTHPANPVLDELIRVIMDADPSFSAEQHGYLVLIEEGDQDAPLSDIGWDEYRLATLPYEGITKQEGHYVAIVLCNNEYGLVFVIPEHLVCGELADVVRENLDPPVEQQDPDQLPTRRSYD